MRRPIFWLLVISVLLMSCSNADGGNDSSLHDFDNSDLREQLNQQDFKPKLPSKTPIEVKDAQFDPPIAGHEIVTFDLYGEGSHMGLMMVRGKEVSNRSDNEYEEVEIGDVKGEYGVDDAGVMHLDWTDDRIHYRLTYYGEQSEKEITKEELIETAESFE
jgi:hypothetical protein